MQAKTRRVTAALCLAVALGANVASAASESETELAKKTQNPMADLISVPFQNNFNFGAGRKDKMIYVLNVQPVIPFHLTENWNLIARVITPIIDQPSLFPRVDNASGLGDINPTLFLSPAKSDKLIWGVGPTMTLPTATNSLLGSGKWSMGPAAVGLFMDGPWVFGALVTGKWIAAEIAGRAFTYTAAARLSVWSLTLPQVAATLAATLVAFNTFDPVGQRLLDDRMLHAVFVLMLTTAILGPVLTQHYAPLMVRSPSGKEDLVRKLNDPERYRTES